MLIGHVIVAAIHAEKRARRARESLRQEGSRMSFNNPTALFMFGTHACAERRGGRPIQLPQSACARTKLDCFSCRELVLLSKKVAYYAHPPLV
jgi:hypothetical protein